MRKYGLQAAKQIAPQSGCPEIPKENRIEADESVVNVNDSVPVVSSTGVTLATNRSRSRLLGSSAE